MRRAREGNPNQAVQSAEGPVLNEIGPRNALPGSALSPAAQDPRKRFCQPSWTAADPPPLKGRSNIWLALGMCLVAGGFATCLQHRLYQVQAPFFDSLSYYEKLHRVMVSTRQAGWSAGWQEMLHGSNTVCLPYLLSIPLASLVEPRREIGIWIQAVELFLLLWSLDIYLRRQWGADRQTRSFALASLFSLACVYYKNGGLSDFRMDFSLMVFYGLSSLWYLTALKSGLASDYFKAGLAISAGCLFRATAPVYFAATFGPLLLVTLWQNWRTPDGVWRTGRGILILVTAVCLLAGWYYLINFDYLYYYYFVWNTDANAGLPISESLGHLKLAFRALGEPAVGLAAFLLGLGWIRWRFDGTRGPDGLAPKRVDGNWVWVAAAPLMLLVVRRAGLNPFVSMPSAIGAYLLAVQFWPRLSQRFRQWDWWVVWGLLILAVAGAGFRGWKKHGTGENGTRQAQETLLQQIVRDAKATDRRTIHFETLSTTEISTSSLWSLLIFDATWVEVRDLQVRVGDVQLMPSRVFFLPAQADWDGLAGQTEAEKLRLLVELATAKIDYLIAPTAESAAAIASEKFAPRINFQLVALREMLLANGNWRVVSPAVADVRGRSYEIYRNMRDER